MFSVTTLDNKAALDRELCLTKVVNGRIKRRSLSLYFSNFVIMYDRKTDNINMVLSTDVGGVALIEQLR